MERWNDLTHLDASTGLIAWTMMLQYPKKAIPGLIEENGTYSMYSLAQLRYIERFIGGSDNIYKCMEKYKRTEETLSTGDIIKYIDEEIDASISLKDFTKNQRENLKAMFKVIFDDEVSLEAIKNEDGEYELNILDFGFCRYLLDSFNQVNAKKFRKRKYEEIEPWFLYWLKKGASMFVKYHANEILEWRIKNRTTIEKVTKTDTGMPKNRYVKEYTKKDVKRRWNNDFGEKKIKLHNSIEKLENTLKQICELENKRVYISMFKHMARYIDSVTEQLNEWMEERERLRKVIDLENIDFSDDFDYWE